MSGGAGLDGWSGKEKPSTVRPNNTAMACSSWCALVLQRLLLGNCLIEQRLSLAPLQVRYSSLFDSGQWSGKGLG